MVNNWAGLKKAVRQFGTIALGACFVCLPTLCRAANNCPWINEATASGILGGDAVGQFTEAAPGQTRVCVFTQENAGFRHTLLVSVEVAADPHERLGMVAQICGSNAAPLKAIGNEAMTCSASDHSSAMGEHIVGRVRDQVFTITLSTTLKNDPVLTRDALKIRIFTAAEQVSGNLF
jgi:hypothetical protein